MQVLSGEPGAVFIAALVTLAVVAIFRRSLLTDLPRLALAVAAAVAFAAVGLVPALALLTSSSRLHANAVGVLKWSMHPARALEWIWPLPFGSEGTESWFAGAALGMAPGDPFFSFSLFVGVPVLLLALLSARERRFRTLLLASAGFLVLALGSYSPLYLALRAAGPLRLVNFPEKLFFGALLLWCVAAGVGFGKAFQTRLAGPSVTIAALSSSVFLAAAGLIVHLERTDLATRLAPRAGGVNVAAGIALASRGAEAAAVGCAVFGAALLLVDRAGFLLPQTLAFAGVLGPLLFAAHAVTATAPRALLGRIPRVLAELPRPPLSQRDVRPRLLLYPEMHVRPALTTGEAIAADIEETLDVNVAARFGYDVLPGFEPGDSAASRRFWEEVSPQMSFLAFIRLFGVDFALIPSPETFAPGMPVFARLPGWGVVGTFPVRPRAFVAPRSTPVASADEGLRSLTWPDRESDPARVVVTGAGAERLDTRGPLEPCTSISPRPEDVVLDCVSPSGGYAVLLDEHVPGWSADVDGKPTRILTADGLFRAVRIGAGAHRVAFHYETPGLRIGAAVSILALLGTAAVFWLTRGA